LPMRLLPILLPLALGITFGCSGGTGPVDAHVDTRSALALWHAQGSSDYRFEFQRFCFCAAEYTQPVTVEVRHGRIVSVRSSLTGESFPLTGPVPWYTVEDLFRLVQDAQRAGTAELRVEYHPSGYPALIEIGSFAADAAVRYTVGDVRRKD
jgi:hypothetical protein